jgi:hypothetical protein
MFFVTQFATFGILVLAANTAYADFPRLSSIIAKDRFLPRQFENRGDRLVFSNGIVVLGLAAAGLVVVFGGIVNALIPLYAVGVFTGFTLSQAGMLVRHGALRERGWQVRAAFSAVGALTTLFVAGIVVVVKFTDGAWIPAVVIPSMMGGFLLIKRHYARVHDQLAVEHGYVAPHHTHFVVVLVNRVNKATLKAMKYAESLRPDRLTALSLVSTPEEANTLAREWDRVGLAIPLETRPNEFRDLTQAVVDAINELDDERSDDLITVVIPEFVTSVGTGWLHNQSALGIKLRLLRRPNTVVTSVPVVIDEEAKLG